MRALYAGEGYEDTLGIIFLSSHKPVIKLKIESLNNTAEDKNQLQKY